DADSSDHSGRQSLLRALEAVAAEAGEGGGLDAAVRAVRRAAAEDVEVVSVAAGSTAAEHEDPHAVTLPVHVGGKMLGEVLLRFPEDGERLGLPREFSPETRFVAFFTIFGFCFEVLYLWAVLNRVNTSE